VNILFLDTSTVTASLALKCEDKVYYTESKTPNSHIEELDLLLSDLFQQAAISSKDLSAIVIGSGPGSFTGLRIGYSYAFGLAVALKIPVIQEPTFLACCENYKNESEIFAVLADARRSEAFLQVFEKSDSKVLPLTETEIVKISQLQSIRQKYLDTGKTFVFIGSLISDYEEDISIKSPERIAAGMAANFNLTDLNKFSYLSLSKTEPEYLRAVSALKISERTVKS
jgi:tRNA threonylcarbamoyladenosine biosynthesis protein TsaB